MNRKLAKILRGLFILLAALFSLQPAAFAASEVVDLDAVGSIMVAPSAGGTAVGAGMTFTAYQVADVYAARDGALSYELTDAFAESGASLDDLEASGLAQTLADYAAEADAPGTAQTAGAGGVATFTNLPVGAYLFVQSSDGGTGYTVKPFIATVPLDQDGSLAYNVDASPKAETSKLADVSVTKVWNDGKDTASRPKSISVTLYRGSDKVETVTLNEGNSWSHTWSNLAASDSFSVKEETVSGYQASYSQKGNTFTITNTPKLVQTGQLNWPIPVLAGCGVVLFAVGWGLVFLKGKNRTAN